MIWRHLIFHLVDWRSNWIPMDLIGLDLHGRFLLAADRHI